mmetsp:Transcript_42832/g.119218  ORF Transcript_42832/g.119218 Transcript_42832/m.119218 type:complete len:102 (-) Transcript_42832:1040-1345(-)
MVLQVRKTNDLDLLPSTRGPVLCRDGKDAIPVDLEGHLDLGHASRRGRDALEPEGFQLLVVSSHRPLTLQYDHLDGVLRIFGCGEEPCALGRDCRVALDHR